MPAMTPNSLSTTGHAVPYDTLNKMTTTELLAYFVEVRAIQARYEAEAEAIKIIALTRADLPKKYLHPDPAFGGASQKSIGGKSIINTTAVYNRIGHDLFMKACSITKGALEEVATPVQMKAMVDDNTIQGGSKSVTLQYDKP